MMIHFGMNGMEQNGTEQNRIELNSPGNDDVHLKIQCPKLNKSNITFVIIQTMKSYQMF